MQEQGGGNEVEECQNRFKSKSCITLIFLDHNWYRLGYVRNSRLYGGFTRTYGHLGSPILAGPTRPYREQLNAYSGNDGKPGIESTNIIMLYNDLC